MQLGVVGNSLSPPPQKKADVYPGKPGIPNRKQAVKEF